jgi:hypothetical protein
MGRVYAAKVGNAIRTSERKCAGPYSTMNFALEEDDPSVATQRTTMVPNASGGNESPYRP